MSIKSTVYTLASLEAGHKVSNLKQLRKAFPQFNSLDFRRKASWEVVATFLYRLGWEVGEDVKVSAATVTVSSFFVKVQLLKEELEYRKNEIYGA